MNAKVGISFCQDVEQKNKISTSLDPARNTAEADGVQSVIRWIQILYHKSQISLKASGLSFYSLVLYKKNLILLIL